MRSVLEDKFGKEPESFDERSDGESCLFAFSVADDGRPLFDTIVLSTCAWAKACTLDPGPESAEWLAGFETIASKIATGFAERLAASQDDAHSGSTFANPLIPFSSDCLRHFSLSGDGPARIITRWSSANSSP